MFCAAGPIYTFAVELVVGIFTRRGMEAAHLRIWITQINELQIGAQVFPARQNLANFFMIGLIHAVTAGFQQGFDQSDVRIGIG